MHNRALSQLLAAADDHRIEPQAAVPRLRRQSHRSSPAASAAFAKTSAAKRCNEMLKATPRKPAAKPRSKYSGNTAAGVVPSGWTVKSVAPPIHSLGTARSTTVPVMQAINVALNTRDENRCSSSSMTNNAAANGALNATANPAPAPAAISVHGSGTNSPQRIAYDPADGAAHLHGRAFAAQSHSATDAQRTADEFHRQDQALRRPQMGSQHGFDARNSAAGCMRRESARQPQPEAAACRANAHRQQPCERWGQTLVRNREQIEPQAVGPNERRAKRCSDHTGQGPDHGRHDHQPQPLDRLPGQRVVGCRGDGQFFDRSSGRPRRTGPGVSEPCGSAEPAAAESLGRGFAGASSVGGAGSGIERRFEVYWGRQKNG